MTNLIKESLEQVRLLNNHMLDNVVSHLEARDFYKSINNNNDKSQSGLEINNKFKQTEIEYGKSGDDSVLISKFHNAYVSGDLKEARKQSVEMDTYLREQIPTLALEILGYSVLDSNKSKLNSVENKEVLLKDAELVIKAYSTNNSEAAKLDDDFSFKYLVKDVSLINQIKSLSSMPEPEEQNVVKKIKNRLKMN